MVFTFAALGLSLGRSKDLKPSADLALQNGSRPLIQLIVQSLVKSSFAGDIYTIPLKTFEGKDTQLVAYRGQVLLIVNTASRCGFTPQLKELQELQSKYEKQGFTVLAFPSNDFKQDPESPSEINKFMSEKYKITFPVFDKIIITGSKKHPLYEYLTTQKSGTLFKEVSWNFEKFLINRKGQVIDRWNSMTTPMSSAVVSKIETALNEKN